MRHLFAALRFLIAAVIAAAVVGQLLTSIAFWTGRGVDDLSASIVNFFSFFTVEANIAAAVIAVIGAFLLIVDREVDPPWFQVARAAVVSYMVTTGVVYNLLLRGIELPQGSTLAWSNEVLHVIAPAYLLVDWILAPGRARLTMRTLRIVVVFPIVWAVYTLIRGPVASDPVLGTDYWYPYPFLNPATSANGYLSVSFYVVLIAAVICLVAAGVVWLSRRGPTRGTDGLSRSGADEHRRSAAPRERA